ncbi:sterol carrier family protein [Frankia sp. Cppng1_Ct_nod]|uniref:sterol carrier family protein n=1 Tax=Frankia sp. Cppng1_Ct_nod TaxID=2897162 RepID=UPI001F5F63CA|nr:sterol carrier family protein [Frankia sp. Cppng1_Ct_nod]
MVSTARHDDPKLVSAVVGQWERVADGVDALTDEAFAQPSRLPGRTVADLVGQIVRSVSALSDAIAHPDPPPSPPAVAVTLADYLSGVLGVGVGAGVGAEMTAEMTAETARTRLRGCVVAAASGLDGADPRRQVVTPAGVMRLGEFLGAQVAEGVVHGIDLGGEPVRDALRLAVRTFTGLLVARAPGRSVEVRIPPFTAVQVVEGPRHTRGTPPNVVEIDPVTFVEVTVGRVGWADAVTDGRVRASGARADLRPYLPLF